MLVGLLVTYVALNLMDGHGQPALLYIVPFTLGTLDGKDYFVITFYQEKKMKSSIKEISELLSSCI